MAVAPPPAPAYRCFVAKLRFYTAHKGCCGEILGEVKDLGGRPFTGGAQVEVTVPNTGYRTLWPVSPNGDYSITALSSGNPYTVRLVGSRVRSDSFDVRYNFNESARSSTFSKPAVPRRPSPSPTCRPAPP